MIFNKRIGIIFFACAVIIVGSIFAWVSHKRLQIIEKEHANLAMQITTLKSRLQTTASDLEQAKDDLKDERSATTDTDRSAMDTAKQLSLMDSWKAEEERMAERMKNDPQLQKEHYEGLRSHFYNYYNVFFTKEHLTSDQADKIINALTQREMDKDDLKTALQDQGLSDDDPSGLPVKQQSQVTFQQAIEDAIGPDGYARFDTYDRQSHIYNLMGNYAARAGLIGSPMTLDQVDQMVDYISQSNPDFQAGKAFNYDQMDWSAVDEQAQKIMTPEQYDFFTHANASERWMQKVNQAIDAIGDASKQNDGDAPAK